MPFIQSEEQTWGAWAEWRRWGSQLGVVEFGVPGDMEYLDHILLPSVVHLNPAVLTRISCTRALEGRDWILLTSVPRAGM